LKITTKTRYGIRAILEIARETNNNGIYQKEISRRQDLSLKYLDQIILALKTANLIMNVKGKKSGYILTKPANQISLLELFNALEAETYVVDCIAPSYVCEKESYCTMKQFWLGLDKIITNYFRSYTLLDLLEKQINIETLVNIQPDGSSCSEMTPQKK
jgi:Rrf2 family protein